MKLLSLDLHVAVIADPNALHVRYDLGDGVEREPVLLNEAESLVAFSLWERGLALIRAAELRTAREAGGSSAEIELLGGDGSAAEGAPLQTDPFALRPRREDET